MLNLFGFYHGNLGVAAQNYLQKNGSISQNDCSVVKNNNASTNNRKANPNTLILVILPARSFSLSRTPNQIKTTINITRITPTNFVIPFLFGALQLSLHHNLIY